MAVPSKKSKSRVATSALKRSPAKPAPAKKAVAKPAAKSAPAKSSSALPTRPELLHLYEQMYILRQSELAAQTCYKKGEMPGFIHLYVGEEAVAVGVCAHLRNDDWATSTHRGHGHAMAKGMPTKVLLAELYAKVTGCCGGRGGSMHLYDPEHGVFGTNGIVGAGIPHAVGAAMSARARGTDGIAVAFFGDGGTSHGAFHESLNFAGAQNAGVLFVCENNLYATATPLTTATKNPEIASRAAAYGIPGVAVDGNDVLAVWQVAREAVARARRGEGPTLIEAKTYRQVGHHEGDPLTGTYRTQKELDAWILKDPIQRFRKRLLEEFKVTLKELDAIDARVNAMVDEAIEFARKSPEPDPATWSLHAWSADINSNVPPAPVPAPPAVEQGWLDAVRDGIAEEMRRDPHILYFGEGTGERGGSFAHTKNLWHEFGPQRLVDTPICELGFTGAAIGASATGCRTVADLMFVDFLFETGGQLPLQASKLRYMSNGQMTAPVVIRAAAGAIKSAGPHHSGTYHSIWAHLPGLIVVMPSNPADAKGLMKSALRGNDPVVFLEPKALFASKGPVPTGEHFVPFGVAAIARPGTDLTIVAAGRMVPLALEAAVQLDKSISCEIIDLRTIAPLDVATIAASVARTHRLLVVDEGYSMCGIGAEVAASVNELAFDELDAPIGRLHMEPVSHPFSPNLEPQTLPTVEKITAAVRELMSGRVSVSRRPQSGRNPAPAPAPHQVAPAEITTASHEALPDAPANTEVPPAPAPAESAKANGNGASAAKQTVDGELVTMPHGDLTVSEAKVVRWLKKVGDAVKKGEAIAEVETDKAVMEIEAPRDGKLGEILAPEGDIVKMGGALGVVS